MAKKQTNDTPTTGQKFDQMYMPEEKLDQMYMPEKAAKKPANFDLYKTVKKAAEEGGMKKGGSVSSASKRADGIAQKGKTKGKIC